MVLISNDKLVRFSNKRLFISGNVVELYEYEKPYSYNWLSYEKKPSGKEKEKREDSVFRSRKKIRRIIFANANQYGYKPIFITFTFKDNVTSIATSNRYWATYIKKMKYKFGKNLKYITVIEFQNKRAKKYNQQATIHYHTLFFNLPYIKNIKGEFSKIWPYGWVKIKTIKHVRSLGAYVSKYLQKEVMDNRLIGNKAFFSSRGLKPSLETRNEKNIDNFLAHAKLKKSIETQYRSIQCGLISYKQFILN